MGYKKLYEERIERAKIAYKDEDKHLKATLERIFPELAESNDEKIKNTLIDLFKNRLSYYGTEKLKDLKVDDILSWIEKQDEPQPYKGNSDVMRKNLINAFKSVGKHYWGGFDVRDIIHFLESKDAIELEKQDEKEPTWSEEDEYQINTILHRLDLKREIYKKEGNKVEEERYKTEYDWLKSLKDRVKPQPKHEE